MLLKATKANVLLGASVLSYVGGIVTYALFGKSVYPLVGGWVSGLLLMEGMHSRKRQNFPT